MSIWNQISPLLDIISSFWLIEIEKINLRNEPNISLVYKMITNGGIVDFEYGGNLINHRDISMGNLHDWSTDGHRSNCLFISDPTPILF